MGKKVKGVPVGNSYKISDHGWKFCEFEMLEKRATLMINHSLVADYFFTAS